MYPVRALKVELCYSCCEDKSYVGFGASGDASYAPGRGVADLEPHSFLVRNSCVGRAASIILLLLRMCETEMKATAEFLRSALLCPSITFAVWMLQLASDCCTWKTLTNIMTTWRGRHSGVRATWAGSTLQQEGDIFSIGKGHFCRCSNVVLVHSSIARGTRQVELGHGRLIMRLVQSFWSDGVPCTFGLKSCLHVSSQF